jgi:hypothetical protein
MTFEEWLAYGVENKFCTEQVCDTHAGYPMTETEFELFEDGTDLCVHVVRLGSEEEWEKEAQALKKITLRP